jgi:hypothetical protein
VSRTFTKTGGLWIPRAQHTATLLKDGTVLVAGGRDRNGIVLASAEIYDPKTGKSTPTGDLYHGRYSASAVLLDDGTVLIIGGSSDFGWVPWPEKYDPASGTFLPMGSPWAAGLATVLGLEDGRVLVAGGDSDGTPTTSVETYDPATGTFSLAADMAAKRVDATSCLLADGRVLIVGGVVSGVADATAEINDTTDAATQELGYPAIALGSPRVRNTTTALADGSVLIVGGDDGRGNPNATIERWYPGGTTTTPIGTMANPRAHHTATRLADGSVLIVGGWSSATTVRADAGLYIP